MPIKKLQNTFVEFNSKKNIQKFDSKIILLFRFYIRMSLSPNENTDKFTKQMQDKFLRDLQNIQIGDSDSQLQASTDFYEGLKKKLNNQIVNMRQSTTKNMILEELKTNINREMNNVEQYEEQIKEMQMINTETQNVINQNIISQIKSRIAKQNINKSKIILADQQVEIKQQQQSQVIFQDIQENQQEIQQSLKQMPKKQKGKQLKSFQKKNNNTNSVIERKIQQANLERQRISMERQDQLSMKHQTHAVSQFFKERFIQFKIPKIQHTQSFIIPQVKKPKGTFTNLNPLPNNEKNVLPKNSPQIALKTLKKNRRTLLMPTSQTSIKIEFKKIDFAIEQVKFKNQQTKSLKSKQKQMPRISPFQNLLIPYLSQIAGPLKQLQKISSSYKPKFIKSYLNENEKISNIDISQIDEAQRSLQHIASNNQLQCEIDPKMLKQFKLTFQKITNLKGIQFYENIEYAALQYNVIKQLNSLGSCRKIIQLNLSNNCIKQIKSIQNLPQLRYLNLTNNKVRQFNFYGGSLQILNLRNNQIQIVTDLNKNKNLRIIDLTQNKLHQIGKGFQQLYFLQEFFLQKNYIESLAGCQNLIMLQKFNVSHNRLKIINKPLTFIFLNYLDLSYNQLCEVPQIFLPSLQKFYITNNKIIGQKIGKTLIYLPELKQFNIDDNQIKGFSIIWFFIRYSKKLQIVKYDSNQYFLSVRQKVRELYQAIIYRNMKNLKILNHSPHDSGIKAYYQSLYSSYLQKGSTLQTIQTGFMKLQQLISFLLKQNKIISNLEDQSSKIKNQRFTEQKSFIQSKSIKRGQFLQKIIKIISQNIKKQSILQEIDVNSVFSFKDHIYFYHDEFQSNLLKKVHKIKSLFYKLKYRKDKRRKYYQGKKQNIKQLLKFIEKQITINQIRKAIKKFAVSLKKNNEENAAIFIQKIWRGYKCRKLFKKMLKKLKQNADDDSFEMQEVDLDQFEAQQFSEFNFDIPDDINFENYIIQPKYFEVAAEQAKKRNSKGIANLEPIQQKNEQYKPMMNNFMKEEKKKQEKLKLKQNDEKLMKEWGFQNPSTLQALRWRQKRKDQMKKKQAQQNMTASQRYQRFKMMHK